MDAVIFCRPSLGEKRKVLIRSTGSFGTIEDNIIAPTPRKFPNLASCAPKYGRRKPEEPSLFGEAGSEIQNILFHPQNLLAAAANHLMSSPQEEIRTVTPVKITPLRSSNPITLNSPFHIEDGSCSSALEKKLEKITPIQVTSARLYPANGRTRTNTHLHSSRKELNRSRSLSWPGPKMEKAC